MRSIWIFMVLWLVVATIDTGHTQVPKRTAFAYTHVNVIDVVAGKTHANQTVMVRGGFIVEVGSADKIKLPAGLETHDCGGKKYLIPGLWDMHVHGTGIPTFPGLYLANGVTGVRDMFSPLEPLLALRKSVETGTAVGPRMVLAGQIVDGPQPVWPGSIEAKTPEEGRAAVRKVKAAGSDFVKVYSKLPRDVYLAIADEARKQRIPFAGHIPLRVSAAEAADQGQKSVEHLTEVLAGCCGTLDTLYAAYGEAVKGVDASQPEGKAKIRAAQRALKRGLIAGYNAKQANALFAKFKQKSVWHCPTLLVLRNTSAFNDPLLVNDPRLKYMPPFLLPVWQPQNDFRFKDRTAEDTELDRLTYQKNFELIADMHRAGVQLLAGTDVMNPYCMPGFSLHDELKLLVDAGLTPAEALRTATINPARFLGRHSELGTVAVGKRADLVLLEANPLTDIYHTRRIAEVVADGRRFSRSALDALLTAAYAPVRPEQ